MLVADIHAQLMPGARVTHNAKLLGLESEIERQIDVLIEQVVGPYPMRIVVDCKDYESPIDVKGVEEFAGMVNDVRAHAAAMVCPAGFTTTAKKRAKKLNISLFTPVDVSGSHRWSKPLSLPALRIFNLNP
jgi:Restriction endonuclease